MIPLKERLPPFQSLLTPKQRAEIAAMNPTERQAFFAALATSLLIRDQTSTMNRAANSL